MKRCPLCERIWPQKDQQPLLWQKLKRYADGTRSYEQLAQLTGSTPGGVGVALTRMRREGIDVKGREASAYVPQRTDHERFRLFRSQGMTWSKIAEQEGLTEANTYKRARRLELEFGELPRRRHGGRDRGRDYVNLRALRVDAQLPWKMIAPHFGMNQQYVARYWSELCKVYGG